MDIQDALSTGTLSGGKRVFLVGIGGVSMAALAEALWARGVNVSGSDRQESAATRRLSALGVAVHIAEDPGLLAGADSVIRTAAAGDDHVMIAAARERGLPVFERAEAWGALSAGYTHALCVAGTHGKTTTTGMLTHIAMQCGDPAVMLGGDLPLIGGTYRAGGESRDTIILESCEYKNSYHHFRPTTAVILNAEMDHPDFFRDFEDVLESFAQFCEKVPEGGHILLNADDPGCAALEKRLAGRARGKVLRFGFQEGADIRARDVYIENGCHAFDVYCGHKPYTRVVLSVPGLHNAYDALAASAAAWAAGMPGKAIQDGLFSFTGTGRRLELLGDYNGVPVYDDYAHHPTEVKATLGALKAIAADGRVLLVFQPHTYTRTAALFDDFARALGAADVLFLAEIYAAREVSPEGLSSARLRDAIPGSFFAEDFQTLAQEVRKQAGPGDVICVMGAGDIRKVGEMILE